MVLYIWLMSFLLIYVNTADALSCYACDWRICNNNDFTGEETDGCDYCVKVLFSYGPERVSRSCMTYRYSGIDLEAEDGYIYKCYTDLCNSAPSLRIPALSVIVALISNVMS